MVPGLVPRPVFQPQEGLYPVLLSEERTGYSLARDSGHRLDKASALSRLR